jgi:cell division septation protein DedD
MSNKNVLAVFIVGLALLLAAFWSGLYLLGNDSRPRQDNAGHTSAEPAPTQAVSTPASTSQAQEQTETISPDTRYIVQVSAYGTAEKANELVGRLKKQKYLAAYTQSPTETDPLYRVCIGSFTVREQAEQVASELSGEGFKGVMIIPAKPN